MQVYGIASEDMDSLTFATPKLVRNLMKPQTQNLPINEYDYDKVGMFLQCACTAPCERGHLVLVICAWSQHQCGLQVLEGLSLTPDQFVDLCILCGCDYCGTIKGTSPTIFYAWWCKQACSM